MACPICFDTINEETGSVVMSCKHSFHLACITEWLGRNQSCPCCRKKPNEKELVKSLVPRTQHLWNEVFGREGHAQNTHINRYSGGTSNLINNTDLSRFNTRITTQMINNIQAQVYQYRHR